MLDKWLGLMRGSEVPPHLREIAGMPRDQIEVINMPHDNGLIGGNGRWFSTFTPQQEPTVVELPQGNRFWQHAPTEDAPQGYLISTVDINPRGELLTIGTSLERGLANLSHLQLSPAQAREDINMLLTRAAQGEDMGIDLDRINFPGTLYKRQPIQSYPYAVPTVIPTELTDAAARYYGLKVQSDEGHEMYSFPIDPRATALTRVETGGGHLGSYVVGQIGGRQIVPHPGHLVGDVSDYYYDFMLDQDDIYWPEDEFESFDDWVDSLDDPHDIYRMNTKITGIYEPPNYGGGLWTPPGALTGKP